MLPPPPPPPLMPLHYKTRWDKKSVHEGHCCVSNIVWDRLFREGYRADVVIFAENGGVICAHASILGIASPVLKSMLKKENVRNGRSHRTCIKIPGMPYEAVRAFIRFLYSSSYEEEEMNQYALSLLVLSHAYVVPHLKQLCACWLEKRSINVESVIDIFQLSLLCDAPRLSLICHRFVTSNLKAVSSTDGWKAMKESHPVLENQILESLIDQHIRKEEAARKSKERKVYIQLYDAMQALVHICSSSSRKGSKTEDAQDIIDNQTKGSFYEACKGLEMLVGHFSKCKMRSSGACVHCKRMWQILELHSRLCSASDDCRVPLCRNFRQRRRKQSKKEDMRWRLLVKKIVRSKSINGGPFFCLDSP